MNLEGMNIFEFADYRKFLKAYQVGRQRLDPAFTASRLCRDLGLPNTRSYFNDLLKGNRNLSPGYVERFIRVLKMGPDESQYFRILVYFDQSTYEKKLEAVLGAEMSLRRWKRTAIFEPLSERLCLKAHKWFLSQKRAGVL